MVLTRMSYEDFLAQLPNDSPHGGCGGCGSGEAPTRGRRGSDEAYLSTAVRFGYMRYIGAFTYPPDMRFTCGAKVVIQTRRGIELGEQVALICTDCEKSVTLDQAKAWVAQCGDDAFIFDAGRILREATAADLAEYARIQESCRQRRFFCQQVADRNKLPIRVVECECPFGGERIVFYFTAAERVDFRAVVRDLAREYRTRIEMRQIGARDEARLLADYETCGREVCCKAFLKTLRPISMRMAKLQKATLDPSQVSGRCGRLKCCLRYEHASYEDLDDNLPKVGVRIRTEQYEGVVVNRQVLTQLVQIRIETGEALITVAAEDITKVNVPPSPEDGTPREKTDGQAPGRRQPAGQGKPRRGKPRAPAKAPRPAERKEPTASAEQPAGEETPSPQTETSPTRRRRRGRRRRSRRRRPGVQNRPDQGSSPAGNA